MEDMAAAHRRDRCRCPRDGDQRGHGGFFEREWYEHHQRHPASREHGEAGLGRGIHDHNGPRSGRVDDDHGGGRQFRYDDDDCGDWRRIHDDDLVVSGLDGRSWSCWCPPDIAAADRKLDQPSVHDDGCGLEHRLGVSLRACAGHGSGLPGIHCSGWLVSDRDGGDQRDRSVRAVGDLAVQPRVPDAGRADHGQLHLDRQGHRLVVKPVPLCTAQLCNHVATQPRHEECGSGLPASEVLHARQFGIELVEEVVVAILRLAPPYRVAGCNVLV